MGATAAIGAGLSVVGGLSKASSDRKAADAQRKAIANQNQIDQLNSQLQLLSLQQSRAADGIQNQLRQTVENQAYLARLGQLDMAETQQQMAIQDALLQAQTQKTLAGVNQAGAQVQALDQAGQQKQAVASALVQAVGASTEEQQQVLSRLQAMPEGQRAATIAALLDSAAAGGSGQNETLRLLAELSDRGTLAAAARAEEAGTQRAELAKASATAANAQIEAGYNQAVAGAGVQAAGATFAANTAALDAQTASEVGKAAFATERLATTGAKAASDLALGVENQARSVNYSANEEVLQRGAVLSNATATAQINAVRSPGFFDYMSIPLNAYSTYTGLGGNFGFLNRSSGGGSSAIRQGRDTTTFTSNIG